jgi:hypothetical protein
MNESDIHPRSSNIDTLPHKTTMATNSKAIPLYRSILRAHAKYLPPEMRGLGDEYVKTEFRLFRTVTDETQLVGFYKEWDQYVNHVLETARAKNVQAAGIVNDGSVGTGGGTDDLYKFGAHLESNVEMTDEQKAQLSKLKEEAYNTHK